MVYLGIQFWRSQIRSDHRQRSRCIDLCLVDQGRGSTLDNVTRAKTVFSNTSVEICKVSKQLMVGQAPRSNLDRRRITGRCNSLLRSPVNKHWPFLGSFRTEGTSDMTDRKQQLRGIRDNSTTIAHIGRSYGAIPLGRFELGRFAPRERAQQPRSQYILASPGC